MERRNVSGFEQLYSSGIGTIGKYMQMKEESKIQVLYVFVSLSHHSAWLHIRRVTCVTFLYAVLATFFTLKCIV